MDGWTGGQTNGWTDRPIDGWIDGRTDRRTDIQTIDWKDRKTDRGKVRQMDGRTNGQTY